MRGQITKWEQDTRRVSYLGHGREFCGETCSGWVLPWGLAVDVAAGLAVRCHGKYYGSIRRHKRGVCRGSAMADGHL